MVLRPGECMFDGERWYVAEISFNCSLCVLRTEPCSFVECRPDDSPWYHLVEVGVMGYINQQVLSAKDNKI